VAASQRFATRLLLGPAVLAASLALASAARAATVTLYAAPSGTGTACTAPGDPCTLTNAIDAAPASGTVTIDLAAGTYPPPAAISSGSESLTLAGSGATIQASGGAAITVSAAGITLTLEQLTVEGGSPGVDVTAAASLTLLDSTLAGNTGDGLDASAGQILIEDSTLAANQQSGALDDGAAGFDVYGSTIEGNGASGLAVEGATAGLGADLLAANGPDCTLTSGGAITDYGYDDADDSSCAFTTSHGSDSSLALAAPAANGGPAQTARLESVGDPDVQVPVGVTVGTQTASFCAGTDERGVSRTQGPATACEAGAYQYAPPVITSVSPRSSLEPGLAVTLSGYGFANGTSASFGSTAAPIASQTGATISLTVPTLLPIGSQPITLTNPDGSAQVAFDAVAPPAVASWILAPGQLKVPYSQAVPSSGGAGPFAFKLVSGALPAGLTLAGSGVVSGTPTKAGGSAFSVQITDANGVSSQVLDVSLVIATPVVTFAATRVTVTADTIPLALDCQAAPCTGTAKLTEAVTVKRRHHATTTQTIVLAAATYAIGAGQTGTIQLALTQTGTQVLGRRALRRARKHALSETLSVAVQGGTTESSTVRIY